MCRIGCEVGVCSFRNIVRSRSANHRSAPPQRSRGEYRPRLKENTQFHKTGCEIGCYSAKLLIISLIGGERGIRTPGPVKINGFQDRRIRPLCHLSRHKSTTKIKSTKTFGTFFSLFFHFFLGGWVNVRGIRYLKKIGGSNFFASILLFIGGFAHFL